MATHAYDWVTKPVPIPTNGQSPMLTLLPPTLEHAWQRNGAPLRQNPHTCHSLCLHPFSHLCPSPCPAHTHPLSPHTCLGCTTPIIPIPLCPNPFIPILRECLHEITTNHMTNMWQNKPHILVASKAHVPRTWLSHAQYVVLFM